MPKLDLLGRLPRTRRNIAARATAKSPELVARAMRFEFDYFDGSRDYGYGGYRYDGRWGPVAQDIVAHYGLRAGQLRKFVLAFAGLLGEFAASGLSVVAGVSPQESLARWDLCKFADPQLTDAA